MVLKAAAKLTCLNRLLACVPIESAFGYSQVFCGLGVLQPGIEIRGGGELLAGWGTLRGPDQQFPSTLPATLERDGPDPASGTPRRPQQLVH